jgi:ATP-dependent protease HslVU (ClpYQ) peptidase subunit
VTVIVGLVAPDGTIHMGGDSAFSCMETHEIVACSNRKVFANGAFLIGVCGSARVGDILRYSFVPPKHPRGMDAGRFMRTAFVDAVRETFRKGGLYFRDEPERMDGVVLVGYRKGLYVIDEDLHIHEAIDDFAAVGSGGPVASGAMVVSHGLPAAKRIKAALEAAERFTASVRRPFYVLQAEAR